MSVQRKICCRVKSIIDHGGRVYTVDLVPASPVPSFRPGQFLHLTVDDYDASGFWPESRVFSIASSPRDRSRIRICYSVKGRYTTKMERELRMGGTAWIKLPYGEFIVEDSRDAALLAGGTGISAFTAFLEALTAESRRKVTLVYGARTPQLFLFNDIILAQLKRVPNFSAVFFSEAGNAGFSERLTALPKATACFSGRISLDLLWSNLVDPANRVYYLSGPPVMLNALTADLKSRGLPPDRIRTDAWE